MFKNIPLIVLMGYKRILDLHRPTLTAVPQYFWNYGWDWFIFGVFLFFMFRLG